MVCKFYPHGQTWYQKIGAYLPLKDLLEDAANILRGPGEQTHIATPYTSKPRLVSFLNIVLASKLLS